MLLALEEKDYKWLFPTPGIGSPSIDEFNQMVDEVEQSPTITYDEFKKEIDEWLEKHL